MPPAFTCSKTSIRLRGKAIPGAEDRQRKISGFDQEVFSRNSGVCVGAGEIISQIAPTLVRKGIGEITLLVNDITIEPLERLTFKNTSCSDQANTPATSMVIRWLRVRAHP